MKIENREQTMVLLASASFGKSAFAAQLVEEEMKEDIVAFHICSNEIDSNLDPEKFVEGLVVSLAKNISGFTANLLKLVELQVESNLEEPLFNQKNLDHFNDFLKKKRKKPQVIIHEFILVALKCLGAKDGKVKLVVVDSLDEAAL